VSRVLCSNIGENLPESEYYHSALRWFDEERDGLESSADETPDLRESACKVAAMESSSVILPVAECRA
jgi:hypothetical protein